MEELKAALGVTRGKAEQCTHLCVLGKAPLRSSFNCELRMKIGMQSMRARHSMFQFFSFHLLKKHESTQLATVMYNSSNLLLLQQVVIYVQTMHDQSCMAN
eukprot:910950-Pleurochrysis_carterae.AAC.10